MSLFPFSKSPFGSSLGSYWFHLPQPTGRWSIFLAVRTPGMTGGFLDFGVAYALRP